MHGITFLFCNFFLEETFKQLADQGARNFPKEAIERGIAEEETKRFKRGWFYPSSRNIAFSGPNVKPRRSAVTSF